MRTFIAVGLAICSASCLSSQLDAGASAAADSDAQASPPVATSLGSTTWTLEYQLRQNLKDKNVQDKPARIQYSNPSGEKATAAIDAGVSITAIAPFSNNDSVNWEFSAGSEYHRNDAPKNKNDSLIAGLVATANIALSYYPDSAPGAPRIPDSVLYPSFALKYKDDKVKDTQSAVPSFTITGLYEPLKIGYPIGGDLLTVVWQPTVGTELEKVYEASSGPTGYVARATTKVEVSAYPLITKLDARLELTASQSTWFDYSESGSIDSGTDTHRLTTLGAMWWFNTDKHFGLGLDYSNGEDPSVGKPEQELFQLSFLVKF
jgi:hypothetical protein